jgi:hypothetical protein
VPGFLALFFIKSVKKLHLVEYRCDKQLNVMQICEAQFCRACGLGKLGFANVLLCHRCGISALKFNRSTVFLIFFCGWAKNNLLENQ